MRNPMCGLPRTYLLRTRLHKGLKKGRSCYIPALLEQRPEGGV
jgi:hypothetical protein